MPIAMILEFLGSKLGGWAVAGALLVALGATWQVEQWRIEAKVAKIEKLQGDVAKLTGQVVTLHELGERKDRLIDSLTTDAAVFKAKAERIATDLVKQTAAHEAEALTLMKRIADAQTAADHLPVPPGMVATLVGLLEPGPGPDDGAGAAPDRETKPRPVGADPVRTLRPGGT